MSRPAALHSGCPSPGCTERASSPRRFPSTHPAAEKPPPQLPLIAARHSTSPFLCCPTDPVSFGRHSQGLQSTTARKCRPEAARRTAASHCTQTGLPQSPRHPHSSEHSPPASPGEGKHNPAAPSPSCSQRQPRGMWDSRGLPGRRPCTCTKHLESLDGDLEPLTSPQLGRLLRPQQGS